VLCLISWSMLGLGVSSCVGIVMSVVRVCMFAILIVIGAHAGLFAFNRRTSCSMVSMDGVWLVVDCVCGCGGVSVCVSVAGVRCVCCVCWVCRRSVGLGVFVGFCWVWFGVGSLCIMPCSMFCRVCLVIGVGCGFGRVCVHVFGLLSVGCVWKGGVVRVLWSRYERRVVLSASRSAFIEHWLRSCAVCSLVASAKPVRCMYVARNSVKVVSPERVRLYSYHASVIQSTHIPHWYVSSPACSVKGIMGVE
jgi:hypothetical protein